MSTQKEKKSWADNIVDKSSNNGDETPQLRKLSDGSYETSMGDLSEPLLRTKFNEQSELPQDGQNSLLQNNIKEGSGKKQEHSDEDKDNQISGGLKEKIVSFIVIRAEETDMNGDSSLSTPDNAMSVQKDLTIRRKKVLRRTPTTFWEDALKFKDGSIPQSIIVAIVIGVACGTFGFIYYKTLEWGLDFFWRTLPEKIVVDKWPEWAYIFWIPLVGMMCSLAVFYTIKYIGEPGDMPITVKYIHEKGYLDMKYAFPMCIASLLFMFAGGSLGPEAPLGGICASIAGWISRKVFKQTDRNIIRKHTLMGMAGALAGFFGSPIGGSFFALEIQSRLGVEYFEHTIEAIFCGQITMAVFRGLAGLDVAPLWKITDTPVSPGGSIYVLIGALLGLFGAFIAYFFKVFHKHVMLLFVKLNLLKPENRLKRAVVGATGFIIIGMFIPYTLFWGENELQTILTNGPPQELPYAFPAKGLIDFKMDSALNCFLVGFLKLVSISFCLAADFRGGFIFPFFLAGGAFGQFIHFLFPLLPVPYACLCIAAGINVAITRTAVATPIILTFLANEPNTISATSSASIVALLATSYMVRKDMLLELKN